MYRPRLILRLLILSLFLLSFSIELTSIAQAERGVEIPALAARSSSSQDLGTFTVEMVWWDEQPEPDPIALRYGRGIVNSFEYGRIHHGRSDLHATVNAFTYALQRTPEVPHTGTVNVQGIAYGTLRIDGPSAGAVMAVGFIALLRGDSLKRGIALTGTLGPYGSVGPVGGIPGKIRAAAREGYHTVLIPSGQLSDPQWELRNMALDLGITIKEVSTIDEAYELMTGESL